MLLPLKIYVIVYKIVDLCLTFDSKSGKMNVVSDQEWEINPHSSGLILTCDENDGYYA